MTTTMTKTKTEETPREVATVERTQSGVTYSPRFDIWETDDELVLCGDLPGVPSDKLDIEFENRVLTIHGKVAPRHENRTSIYGEYGVGDFYRTFTIGESIDAEKIVGEMKNGVLTIHLPKAEAVRPRRIEVKS